MMMQILKSCLPKFDKSTVLCLVLLLSYFSITAQQKCEYQNFWYKADYKNLDHAKAEYNHYTDIINRKVHDTLYAKAYNTIGLYHDFSGNNDSAIYYFKKSLTRLKKYPKKQIAPMINIATEYNILGSFDKSLQWSKRALGINKKYPNDIDLSQIYHALAATYLYQGKIEHATASVLKGIKILEKHNDKCYLEQLKLTLAGTYLQANNYRFAADLIEEYLDRNNDNRDSKIYAIATVNYTENLIELDQKDKAFTLLTDLIPYVQRSGDKELEAVVYGKCAYIENLRGNLHKSLRFYSKAHKLLSEKRSKYSMLIFSNYISVLNSARKYNEAIELINEFRTSPAYLKSHTHERFEYEKSIAAIYSKTNNWKESSMAYKRAMLMGDTLRMLQNGSTLNSMQAQFQTDFQREKNELLANHNVSLEKKAETEKRLMTMYIIASLATLVLVLVLLRGYWLRIRLQKEALKSIENEKTYIEHQHRLEQELSNSQKHMLDEKQREATSMALQMANYYDSLNTVIGKLDNDSLLKISDVKKELQNLTRHKDYWREFEIRFKSANPDFESHLTAKFPNLTRNDVQFCSLLKLSLSYKEIASLLQISYESAVTKRYRIKKKMDINDDEEFEKLLMEI